jgi:hypothetical protein
MQGSETEAGTPCLMLYGFNGNLGMPATDMGIRYDYGIFHQILWTGTSVNSAITGPAAPAHGRSEGRITWKR